MNPFTTIEIVGAILYFLQKIFLSYGKRVGWILGFLGAIAFSIVTLHKGSFAYSVLEISSGILFIIGLIAWKRYETLQVHATIIISAFALISIAIIFLLNLGSPNWILENLMVMLFIVGAVLLVLRNRFGWVLYILGESVLIYYGFIIETYFIVLLQIISLPFSIIGYRNFRRMRTMETMNE